MPTEPNETILETIERRLIPDEQAKKARGEVFTPLNIVRELLYGIRKSDFDDGYTLPWGVDKDGNIAEDDEDDRIGGIPLETWRDPDTKWLDSANGIGNFPFVAFHMLDFQLKYHGTKGSMEWDDEKRKKHIIEKMLFMIEIDRGNVNTSFKVMDYLSPGSKPNICCADTLKLKDEDLQTHFGLNRFDIVMGNPPFQKKIESNKTAPLWDKFIIKSFEILKNKGYLIFITPSGWRNIEGKFKIIQKEIFKRNLQYLEIHNEKDGLNIFLSETRYDCYVVKNENVNITKTIIKFQDGIINTINVKELEFIPNGEYEKVMSMFAKNGEETVDVIYSRSEYGVDKKWMSKEKTEEYKYPCVYTINSKSQPTFYYSSVKNGHFGIPKLIWSNGRISSIGSYIDINGDYGLTQFAYAIVDEPENLQKIKQVFDSKEFRKLMELCAVGQLSINYKIISKFKKDFWKTFIDNKENIETQFIDEKKVKDQKTLTESNETIESSTDNVGGNIKKKLKKTEKGTRSLKKRSRRNRVV